MPLEVNSRMNQSPQMHSIQHFAWPHPRCGPGAWSSWHTPPAPGAQNKNTNMERRLEAFWDSIFKMHVYSVLLKIWASCLSSMQPKFLRYDAVNPHWLYQSLNIKFLGVCYLKKAADGTSFRYTAQIHLCSSSKQNPSLCGANCEWNAKALIVSSKLLHELR